MKRYIIFFISFVIAVTECLAATPVEELIGRYGREKGVKSMTVRGVKMKFARPILRKYPIGPMADAVNELSVLSVAKAADDIRTRFESEMNVTLRQYRFYGKTDTPNGIVEVYAYLESEALVSELVIYNPLLSVLNSVKGKFPVQDLLKLNVGTVK